MLRAFCFVVPEAGIEPAHRFRREILSLLCLPISPLGQFCRFEETRKTCIDSNCLRYGTGPHSNRF